MHTSTIVILTCLLVAVVVQVHSAPAKQESADIIQESVFDTPLHDRSPRTKRGLLLLKKKLILGALGIKAAKIGAAAGLVGLALKSKSKPKSVGSYHTYYHHGPHPSVAVEVHRW